MISSKRENVQRRARYRRNADKIKTAQRFYYTQNAEVRRAAIKAYRKLHPRDGVKRMTSSFRRWLGRCVRAARHSDTKLNRQFGITTDYILELLTAQDFKCAVTGIKLTHELNDLCSASVDRIDSSKGHIIGNVHIVCMWINLARRHYSLEKLQNALDEYFEIRLRKI